MIASSPRSRSPRPRRRGGRSTRAPLPGMSSVPPRAQPEYGPRPPLSTRPDSLPTTPDAGTRARAQRPAGQLHQLAAEPLDEPAVVRDGDDRPGEGVQRALELLEHVEMD